jgi:hypothetical protein
MKEVFHRNGRSVWSSDGSARFPLEEHFGSLISAPVAGILSPAVMRRRSQVIAVTIITFITFDKVRLDPFALVVTSTRPKAAMDDKATVSFLMTFCAERLTFSSEAIAPS